MLFWREKSVWGKYPIFPWKKPAFAKFFQGKIEYFPQRDFPLQNTWKSFFGMHFPSKKLEFFFSACMFHISSLFLWTYSFSWVYLRFTGLTNQITKLELAKFRFMRSRFALVILIGSLELSRFDRFPLAKFVLRRNSLEVYSSRDLKTMHIMKRSSLVLFCLTLIWSCTLPVNLR
jgi:hypothetical protein